MNNSTNGSSSNSSVDDFSALVLANQIVYRGYFLFLILAGTCGNLLTAITLLRAKLRKYTTCQFMAVCALLNIGVLLTHTLNMMLTQGYGVHIRSLYDLGWCRVNAFVAQWIRGMASWILVIIAFDRFRQSKTVRRTPTGANHMVFYTMFIMSFVLIILNMHYLLFTGSRVQLEGGSSSFLACVFYRESNDMIQKFFSRTNTWIELVTITIVPCILTLTLNIFIIKNSFLNPVNNEHLKSRSKSRTRRVTTMLLASNIGFLALVAPAQIFTALSFNPGSNRSPTEYRSFIKRALVHQCSINTYYAASFVFCFVSSSIFRREIKKLLHKQYKPKHVMNRTMSTAASSTYEIRPFIQQTQLSGINYSSNSRLNEYVLERTNPKRATQSTIEGDEFLDH